MDTEPVQEEKINIQLGDIIQIIAPSDIILNNHTFFVKYLDKTKLLLVEENGTETSISFDKTGKLDNESITSIEILSRANSPSYVEQNNLKIGTWIDVYFSGDVPVVFTGKITNVEEDMIEITTYPENDVIFIDFGYKGIPPELPIDKILIREAPSGVVGAVPLLLKEGIIEGEGISEGISEGEGEGISEGISEGIGEGISEGISEGEGERQRPTGKPTELLRDLIFSADQIKIGTNLEAITQEVDVQDSEQRFGIEKQTNDLLDELLSTVPNIKRTESVLNNIHKMIERFKQLRSEFSKFDNQGNALMPAIQGADFKPLVQTLQSFNQKLYWILPVVKNRRKLYDIDDAATAGDENTDFLPLTLAQSRIGEQEIVDNYYTGDFPSEENKYTYLIKSLNPYLTPYTDPTNNDSLHTALVNANITAIINNLDDFKSSVAGINKDTGNELQLKQRKFVIQTYNLGMTSLEMNKIKGGDLIVNRKQLTENDKLTIKSVLMLPEVTVRFSRVTMPSTNILIKSNLNMNYLNYWQLLKQNADVSTTIVDTLDKPLEYEANTFLKNSTEFILDETINETDKYKKYLETIIPKTRVLFDMVKPYINGKLSIYNVLSYLEPFMIYQNDLSFKQYETINEFI